jgi:hypothetical protein
MKAFDALFIFDRKRCSPWIHREAVDAELRGMLDR